MAERRQIPLEIVRGTNNAFGLTITNEENDEEYILENGQALVFGLKMNPLDEQRILTKKITNSVDGAYYLELVPSDTENLPIGMYYYDVGLQSGPSVFYNVIETSPFKIKPNVTKLGDGA